MPFEEEFTRQAIPTVKGVGLVIPENCRVKDSLSETTKTVVKAIGQPTALPHKVSFHYIDYPVDDSILEDKVLIDNGIYEFYVKDAIVQTFDLQTFSNDEFCWSFATTDQLIVLAALNVGNSFDVKFNSPFKQVSHILKYHFPSGVENSGYGEYPIHVTVDSIRPDGFRVVSCYEPGSARAQSRLAFFFGFRIFGFRQGQDDIPLWRQFLSEAVIHALHERWGIALICTAFGLESFIDQMLINALSPSELSQDYIDHILRVGEKRYEFHALFKKRKDNINKYYEEVNALVFKARNDIAHGKKNINTVTQNECITSVKTMVSFIWDCDKKSRKYLLSVLHMQSPESLIDDDIKKSCKIK
ncbi:MAG TPA: hypothetical protein VJZ02_04385 [Candidatus Brocadiales bacterium]|nr:hypothetical protein [Candidatus Brocadiales bacterium]